MTTSEDSKYLSIASTVLDRHGTMCAAAVTEMHDICDLPMSECYGIMRREYDRREMERIKNENAELRKLLVDCMLMPDAYGEKYGIEPNFIVCSKHWGERMRALGIEVD